MNYYNRYTEFEGNGILKWIPFIKLAKKSSDKSLVFQKGIHTTNTLSNDYYGSPYFEWLIRLSNSQFGVDEWEWPDNSLITIPFPLNETINELIGKITTYKQRY